MAADGKAGAGEGLAHHQILRQTQLTAQLPHLVLKEHPQRLDDLLEIHIIRQTAHIVMALDHGCVTCAGLDHIRVNRTLSQVIHLTDFFGFRLKDPDEFLADDLPFALRLADAGQLAQKQFLRVDPDEVDVPLSEGRLYLVSLIRDA